MTRGNIFSVSEDFNDEEGDFDDEAPPASPAVETIAEISEVPAPRPRTRPLPAEGPRIRTRPMPARVRNNWPNVGTMLITNLDGSQILFIRQ